MAATTTKPKNIHEAFLELQKAALQLNLPKSKTNPHFHNKYTPLDVVLDAVIPLLNEHGFALIQSPVVYASRPGLKTKLVYGNGQELEDTMFLMPGREDPQGQGAAITYARRYAIMSMLGLTSDEDDDGNASMRATVKQDKSDKTSSPKVRGDEADAPPEFADSGDSPI